MIQDQTQTSADRAVRILSWFTVRCLSVKINIKFAILALKTPPHGKCQILTDIHRAVNSDRIRAVLSTDVWSNVHHFGDKSLVFYRWYDKTFQRLLRIYVSMKWLKACKYDPDDFHILSNIFNYQNPLIYQFSLFMTENVIVIPSIHALERFRLNSGGRFSCVFSILGTIKLRSKLTKKTSIFWKSVFIIVY